MKPDQYEAAAAVFDGDLPADGACPLDDVEAFLARFVAYPSVHARGAHVLWCAHAHLMECWESTPRIAFLSPEPGSGKSRALEVTELLVPNPVLAVNVSPAYLFRKIGDPDNGPPTVLYDEIDTVFGPKAKENEELRGLLNAGHRRGAVAGRCVVRGKQVFTEEIPAYAAVALAGLGDLPDTILTRSVIVKMRRRAPGENVEPFRRRLFEAEGHALRDRLAAWTLRIFDQVDGAWPTMPDGIADRDADVWEALLAVADAAGGDWPTRAREAAVALVASAKESTPSLGIRLLSDLRTIFGEHDHLATEYILNKLIEIEEAPWGDIRGKPLDARGLSNRLRPYGVESKTVRVGDRTPKGYQRADLLDAWARYLPSSPMGAATRATSATAGVGLPPYASATRATGATGLAGVADVADVADVAHPMGDGPTAAVGARVADVAHVAHPMGDEPTGDLRQRARALALKHAADNELPERQRDAWLADADEDPAGVIDILTAKAA